VKPQGSQTNQGKQDIAEVGKQPLSEAEAFKKAREEMVTAAKTLLDPTTTEAAKAELDRFKAMCGADNSDSDEATGSSESITTFTQSKQAPQAQQQTSTSTMGPMQAYGPINIPPGTMIRRVQNLPAGAVPIDPSMLPPGMIPVHANHPNASSQSMPTADYAQGGSGKPRRTSEDSGIMNAPTPKIPARSKSKERGVKRATPESRPDESTSSTSSTSSSAAPARKTKGSRGGGGGGSGNSQPESVHKPDAAAASGGEKQTPSSSKKQQQQDAPESGAGAAAADGSGSTAAAALPAVKTVPPSPKVYIRKVKGKAKKDQK